MWPYPLQTPAWPTETAKLKDHKVKLENIWMLRPEGDE
jgi:hypothetical protein